MQIYVLLLNVKFEGIRKADFEFKQRQNLSIAQINFNMYKLYSRHPKMGNSIKNGSLKICECQILFL